MKGISLVVLLCGFLVSAIAQSATPALDEAAKAGAAAGFVAGQEAGKNAGFEAGKLAGMQAIRKEHPKPPVAPSKPAIPVSQADFRKFQESDPGATSFFTEFDADDNKRWSQTEFMKAMAAAKERGLIHAQFDVPGTWALLAKTESGEITIREFMGFASKTRAISPSRTARKSVAPTPGQIHAAKPCRERFDAFDRGKTGSLSFSEFKLAVTGKMADDQIKDKFYSLPRTPSNKITFETFSPLCVTLFGIPGLPGAKDPPNPCLKNPCAKYLGTICVPDPKQCIKSPCPQYKCMRTTAAAVLSGPSTNSYGRCVEIFKSYDRHQKGSLNYKEFYTGVKESMRAAVFPNNFRPVDAWNRFEKNAKGEATLYEFIHFCVAVTTDGDDIGASAREECWDVFTHFDADQSQDVSAREFLKGMRRARRQGHLASDLNIHSVWNILPKTKIGTLEVGPFIDFCLSVSKGDDPVIAAKEAQPLPDLSGFEVKAIPRPNVATVGTAPATNQFCKTAFKTLDLDSDGAISRAEFLAGCTLIANETECKNHTGIFNQYDINKDQKLVATEFLHACKGTGVALYAGKAEKARRIANTKAALKKSFLEMDSSTIASKSTETKTETEAAKITENQSLSETQTQTEHSINSEQ